MTRRLWLAAIALALTAVAPVARGVDAPDLATLYASAAAAPKRHPLVIVPGIMGSRLLHADTDREVWPGSLARLLTGAGFGELELPIRGEAEAVPLRPGGIFHEIAGRDFYGRLITTLVETGGYHCVPAESIASDTDCVLFAWDWRRGMVAAAARLDELVETLRARRGDPTLAVDIVAHSAGGLVARYYVRYGAVDVLDDDAPEVTYAGAAKVHQTILIGTPNYGSVTALQRAMTGIPIGLSRIRPETIATMPGMYQLLPHPDRTWMIGIDGARIDLDLYDVEVWRRHRWSLWDPDVRTRLLRAPDGAARLAAFETFFARELARAKRFHRALSRRAPPPPSPYIVFGSACYPTAARCLVEVVDGKTHIRLKPDDIAHPRAGVPYAALMIEPGDGSVTKASLLARDSLDPASRHGDFPVAWATFICERHDELTGNLTFQDNLLNVLLYGVKANGG